MLRKMATSNIQVGSGLRRSRLSRPISRRFTSWIAKMLKQAAIIPYVANAGR